MEEIIAPRQSGLAIPVPEADPLVDVWRRRYDSSAALGVPAHITLLVPFLNPDTIDERVLADLRAIFAGFRRFDFALPRTGRFPDVLYLAPEPAAQFSDLIHILAARYPETPPYGGIYETVIPHLTVAHASDQAVLDQIEHALAPALPITASATEVWLVAQEADGRWRTRSRFPLG
jgi:2'-5' RNA ligase